MGCEPTACDPTSTYEYYSSDCVSQATDESVGRNTGFTHTSSYLHNMSDNQNGYAQFHHSSKQYATRMMLVASMRTPNACNAPPAPGEHPSRVRSPLLPASCSYKGTSRASNKHQDSEPLCIPVPFILNLRVLKGLGLTMAFNVQV